MYHSKIQLINDESAGDVEMKPTASSRRKGTKKTEDLKGEVEAEAGIKEEE